MLTPGHRVVVITGAVGNLGAATAAAFQNAGDKTVLLDRSPDRLRQTFPKLADSPDHWLAGGVDLADGAALARLVADAIARFGQIDVLVNTVGAWRGGKPVHEEDPANWDFLFEANVRTTLNSCRAVIPAMLKQGGGRIVNVASRDGLAGSAGYAAYSASKSAVIRLTEALADELKASDINVNCVLPGTIDTPQNRAANPDGDFTKWVAPAAIAEVITFLASDAARAIQGAAIPVYGKG
ncbi:MAG TPA: SDR family NAD(P)-dependent oxidoreductase [Candidatus Saccharimonadales bacterium]|nr:SDR family NAD(P)-dependent oxidoreductase [Candidatus Saccharimonadales bacterium]